MENKRKIGTDYEKQAAEYLIQKKFRIVRQNFYCKSGEIDIIARDGEYLVFVEVKYRRDASYGSPLEAVNVKKQKRICRAASYFCVRYGYSMDRPFRFDVVAILGNGEITHVQNAFEYRI